jgi:hypothetical protein
MPIDEEPELNRLSELNQFLIDSDFHDKCAPETVTLTNDIYLQYYTSASRGHYRGEVKFRFSHFPPNGLSLFLL